MAGNSGGTAIATLLPILFWVTAATWLVVVLASVAGIACLLALAAGSVAGGNSILKTLARGGVRWRGDFHRLADLRKHMSRS